MSVKIICFDLDGTFLDDQKNIPPENLEALEKAHRRGVFIVPATGRIYKGIPEPLRKADFARYFITANGAYVYDAKEDTAPVRAEISAERAVEFFTHVDGLNVLYDCYQDNWGYMSADMLSLAAETIPDPGIRRLIMGLRTPVPELKAYLREKGMDVQKLQLYFTDMEQRARELRELPERFPDLRFSTSVPFNIEINAAASTKGQAMCSLCKLLGIDPAEAMALGDGTNDLDMIQMAGTGVAMANADPAVLEAADVVTGNNNEGGFAKAVERFAML